MIQYYDVNENEWVTLYGGDIQDVIAFIEQNQKSEVN